MIRFVDLGEQIVEGRPEFAFYNTINDKFIEVNDQQSWASFADFVKDYRAVQNPPLKADLIRLSSLTPQKWKET